MNDESALVKALQQGQPKAYKIFIRHYQTKIYQVCMRMMHNQQEAEDMTQETFIRIIKSISNFKEQSSLQTWVYRIAINLCKNRIEYLKRRHHQKHRMISTLEGDQWQNDTHQPQSAVLSTPDQSLLQKEKQQQIELALNQVEASLRELLVLRDIQGLSYQEICNITDLALGTVKSRIHRARLSFMHYYKQLQESDLACTDDEGIS